MKTIFVLTALVAATCAMQTKRSIIDTAPLEHVFAGVQCSQTDSINLVKEACVVESEALACVENERENIKAIAQKCFATDIASFKEAAKENIAVPDPVKFVDCVADKTIGLFTGKERNALAVLECYQM